MLWNSTVDCILVRFYNKQYAFQTFLVFEEKMRRKMLLCLRRRVGCTSLGNGELSLWQYIKANFVINDCPVLQKFVKIACFDECILI